MKKIIGALALVIALSPAMGQDSPVRDEQLKGLIQAAVNNYPRIKEMEESLKADDVKQSLIKAGYLPTVNTNISYRFDAPVA